MKRSSVSSSQEVYVPLTIHTLLMWKVAFTYSVYQFSHLYGENEKKNDLVLVRCCLFLLTPWGSVLCHFLWSQWEPCAGWPREHQPPYMKVRTAITINYSAAWWREPWFHTLGGYPADPTVCEGFVRLEQTRTFWILTYRGSFSRASPVMRGGTVLGRHCSF